MCSVGGAIASALGRCLEHYAVNKLLQIKILKFNKNRVKIIMGPNILQVLLLLGKLSRGLQALSENMRLKINSKKFKFSSFNNLELKNTSFWKMVTSNVMQS